MNTTGRDTLELIGQGEGLMLEFKSNPKGLTDRELVTAVIAMRGLEAICSTVCSPSIQLLPEHKNTRRVNIWAMGRTAWLTRTPAAPTAIKKSIELERFCDSKDS
jgi:hypothetical protein